jgi:hypothetical protein
MKDFRQATVVRYSDILPLVEALKFYAEKENWARPAAWPNCLGGSDVDSDGGRIAREALAKQPQVRVVTAETSDNVVALPGYSVPTPYGEPVAAVIETLRDSLVRAESGEIRAVSVSCVVANPTETIDGDFAAAASTTWALNAAHQRVGRKIARYIDE